MVRLESGQIEETRQADFAPCRLTIIRRLLIKDYVAFDLVLFQWIGVEFV